MWESNSSYLSELKITWIKSHRLGVYEKYLLNQQIITPTLEREELSSKNNYYLFKYIEFNINFELVST